MGILDFKIGFLPVSIFDILDIIIVAYLMYELYKLLRGNIAFNIFIGLLLLYISWWLVTQLGMELLSGILSQFVSVGVIILIIIFQPEVRRFLLLLGNTTLRQRSHFLDRILDRNFEDDEDRERAIQALLSAMTRMSRRRTGALIVMRRGLSLEGIVSGGVELGAYLSEALIESIFNKESPLHDGAVIINGKIVESASVVLPVSEDVDLPKSVGLRHRAAVGITERANVVAFIVSEETGSISYAFEGQLFRKLSEEKLETLLQRFYS